VLATPLLPPARTTWGCPKGFFRGCALEGPTLKYPLCVLFTGLSGFAQRQTLGMGEWVTCGLQTGERVRNAHVLFPLAIQ
jgi:hypothetical protein